MGNLGMHMCPRDSASLVPAKVRGFAVSHCKTCAGLWLSPALVANALGHLPRFVTIGNPASAKRTPCPIDGSIMHPLRHRGVVIDVCASCGGVWLDHGELDVILRVTEARSDGPGPTSKINIPELAIESAGEIISNPRLLLGAGELAGDAIGAVLSFVGEALSGF